MTKLKPFVERLLYEVIIEPIMLITRNGVSLFNEDPIKYNDFSETLFAVKKNSVQLLK